MGTMIFVFFISVLLLRIGRVVLTTSRLRRRRRHGRFAPATNARSPHCVRFWCKTDPKSTFRSQNRSRLGVDASSGNPSNDQKSPNINETEANPEIAKRELVRAQVHLSFVRVSLARPKWTLSGRHLLHERPGGASCWQMRIASSRTCCQALMR